MSQEMEFESKNLLTKKEYEALNDHLNHIKIKPKTQINYYFETDNFALKEKGAALRIRAKEGQYHLTLKQPEFDGLLETHESISNETLKLWLANQLTPAPKIDRQLMSLNIDRDRLKYGGKLVTERIELNHSNALIVLDKSTYNNITDYELEVEADSIERAEQVMKQLLEKNKIPKRETPNKIHRFYQTINQ